MIHNLTDEMHTLSIFNFNQAIRRGVQTLWVACFKLIMKLKISVGEKYGRLTIIREVLKERGGRRFECGCSCGKVKTILLNSLRMGKTKSCGCLYKTTGITHGKTKTPTYRTWQSMKERCSNINYKKYCDYGGRGIKVCDRWLKFENFYEDMGEKPQNKTLDRVDNDGNYCKENCRWATKIQQANNTRANRYIYYKGERKTIAEWSRELEINVQVLRSRINTYKWSPERALSTPLLRQGAIIKKITF